MSKTKWYEKPIYLLVALALALSLGILAVPGAEVLWAHPGTIQVDVNDPGCVTGPQPDPYSVVYCSIQDAIDDAIGGDVINVAKGTYYESITLKGGVQVLGAGADVTTIDGSTARGGQPAYHVVVGADNATLDGFTVTGGNATGNILDGYGGGMFNNDSSPTVTNCTFHGNSARYEGGGMVNLYDSSPAVTNCIFSDNSADGGGMYNNDSSPTVTKCSFWGNSADRGGGMYNQNESSPTVTKCIFWGNSAAGILGNAGGGGMYNSQSSPTVTNCIFSGNSAIKDGGGMHNLSYSSPTVTNCIFSGNSANQGGGMYNRSYCSPAITNNIIVGNTASYCGGIYAGSNSYPIIDYNDVWNNSPPNYGGCSPGPHDIDQDPMFVNPAARDFHSKPGSPCIDAGTNVGAPTEDMEGNPRPVDGYGDGWAITDMGAYEYVRPTPPPHFRYLHSTGGLFNLTAPIGTQWHELWPFFCNEYHLSSWNDTSGDGVLSRCDRIDIYQKPDGELKWYHVENVTITLNVTHNETGEPMYIELEGGYNASVLTAPNSTQWHEIYPILCRQYELSSWNDTSNITGELDFCDTIELTDKWTEEVTTWHVEEVAVDIIVTIEPPPVGGEAYPVNKFAVLAPWIAVMVLLAGGTSWLALRRRRTQS